MEQKFFKNTSQNPMKALEKLDYDISFSICCGTEAFYNSTLDKYITIDYEEKDEDFGIFPRAVYCRIYKKDIDKAEDSALTEEEVAAIAQLLEDLPPLD